MSTTDTHHTDETHAGIHPTDEHHPTPRQYVQVALVLAVLTAMEVLASFVLLPRAIFIGLLVVLMATKFAFVAGWFMHLRFDTRLFTRVMVGGLMLAGALYTVVLLAFAGLGEPGA